jgi:hypothetical protein
MEINKLIELTEQLFLNTPSDISVSVGQKTVNGINTGEISIVFLVEKKLSQSELSEDQVLPTTIQLGEETIKTDVVEVGVFETYQCNDQQLIADGCYQWCNDNPNPPLNTNITIDNKRRQRPLVGGVSVRANNPAILTGAGTLGIIARDRTTGGYVGLTNAHTIISDPFYTIDRTSIILIENEYNTIMLQSGENPFFLQRDVIGETLRYQPLFKQPTLNYVDAALIALNPDIVVSGQQLNLTANTVGLQFASTNEINQLMTTYSGTEVISTSRTTGAKQGPCGLRVSNIGVSATITGFRSQFNSNLSVNFADLMLFTRVNPDCRWPVAPGDSGSVLIADFDGVNKIIGVVIGGNSSTVGIACRIDRIAQNLDIVRWDGIITDSYFDNNNKEIITLPAGSNLTTLDCNGETYWQIGNTTLDNQCQ